MFLLSSNDQEPHELTLYGDTLRSYIYSKNMHRSISTLHGSSTVQIMRSYQYQNP